MNANQFEIVSGRVFVSDPCYEPDGHCQVILENVHNGLWTMKMIHSTEGAWGRRVAELVCTANDCRPETGWQVVGEMGVDSGQGGIFDAKYYRNDAIAENPDYKYEDSPLVDVEGDGDNWYNLCCDRTLAEEFNGGSVIPYGAVSSSGYGDGIYNVHVQYAKKEIVAIRIVFIGDEEEEEENDDESGYYECFNCGDKLNHAGLCPRCDYGANEEEV